MCVTVLASLSLCSLVLSVKPQTHVHLYNVNYCVLGMFCVTFFKCGLAMSSDI